MKDSFFGNQLTIKIIIALTLLIGFGIRMVDLTDLPLDFHPTRQLYSAIKARGMYYQWATNVDESKRQLAVQLWKDQIIYEPPVMETLVAGTYLFTGEKLWIARIYSSVFWLLGGLALFALARKMTSTSGAMMALLYFVFLHFGILASRSFQPDPLMVTMILVSLWAFYQWQEKRDWKWTVIAGLLSGFAIFVKPMAAFILLGAYAITLIVESGLRSSLNDKKVWTLALLAALPFSIYYIDGKFISGFFEIKSTLRFFPQLWIDPKFYIRWYNMIGNTVGTGAFLLSLFSLALAKRGRALLVGLWLGYIAYSFVFAYFIGTHSYYQLPLILVVAISLAVVAGVLFEKIMELNSNIWIARGVVFAIVLIGVVNVIWDVRVELVHDDYRSEEKFWAHLGDTLGHTSGVIGLTQDYGNRLAYFGWQGSTNWLNSGDLNVRELGDVDVDLEARFAKLAKENKYFVVTLFSQLDGQPAIKKLLEENYPVFAEGDGYKIYDLQHPVKP